MNKTILAISLILMLVSCRSSDVTELAYTKAPKASVLISAVESAHFDFQTLSAKVSGNFESADQNLSFKGNIRIKKDSIIWLSVSPGLGIELGRFLFDRDSVHFINRVNKTYVKSNYSALSEQIQSPLSFETVQNLLVGNSLDPYKDKKHFSSFSNQQYVLSSINPRLLKKWQRTGKGELGVHYMTSVNPNNSKILSQEYRDYELEQSLLVSYDQFESFGEKSLGKTIVLDVLAEKKLSLDLSYSKIKINKPLKTPFKVPNSYEITD